MRKRRPSWADMILLGELCNGTPVGIVGDLAHREPRWIRDETVEVPEYQRRPIAIAQDERPDAVAPVQFQLGYSHCKHRDSSAKRRLFWLGDGAANTPRPRSSGNR